MALFCKVGSPTRIVCDVATKLLGTELLPRYNVADLVSGITFVLFIQHKSLYGERNYTYTRAHTHTHTHTHARTEYQQLVRKGIDK